LTLVGLIGISELSFASVLKRGRFPLGTNGVEISRGRFQKIRKVLNFRKSNHSTETSGNFGRKIKWNGNFQEKKIRKSRYTSGGCPLFPKLCKFAIVHSALVLLAATTASWTSHAKMTDQYFTLESCHLSVDKYKLLLNSSRKRSIPIKKYAAVVYLFVLPA